MNEPLTADDIRNLHEVVDRQAALGHSMTLVPNDVMVRLLAAVPAHTPGLETLVDDVRYAGGNGTSDYWRGFNDGIDKLRAAYEAASPSEETR